MKNFLLLLVLSMSTCVLSQPEPDLIELSQDMLKKIKLNQPVDDLVGIYSKLSIKDIESQLKNDTLRLTFWVNLYNGFIQYTLKKNPELYDNRSKFFKEPRIDIAGLKLSFADVEHGIIRRSQSPVMLGYFKRWFRLSWERRLRVDKRDWRVHFALNCGAKSCPPVAIYDDDKLIRQFDFMTEQYLAEQTQYFVDKNRAETVALFSWFRGDFGGISGAKKILMDYKITAEVPKKISFTSYDWTLYLDNFRDIPLEKVN